MIDPVQARVTRAARQFVALKLDARRAVGLDAHWCAVKMETVVVVIETGAVAQLRAAQIHQHPFEAIKRIAAILFANFPARVGES